MRDYFKDFHKHFDAERLAREIRRMTDAEVDIFFPVRHDDYGAYRRITCDIHLPVQIHVEMDLEKSYLQEGGLTAVRKAEEELLDIVVYELERQV